MDKKKENIDTLLIESRRFVSDTVHQFMKEAGGKQEDYWQGRKDGARLMLAIIMDNLSDKDGGDLRSLVDSSPMSRKFDWELANELLEDAVYNVSAILYELEDLGRADIRTKINLKNFVLMYDVLSRQGKFPVIDDHCQ